MALQLQAGCLYHFLASMDCQSRTKGLTFTRINANTDTYMQGADSMKKCTTLDVGKTGQNIKRAIQDSDYTVRELQELLHLGCIQPIYRWMAGRTLPSLDNLYILCKLLGVSIEDVLVERGADL